MRVPGRRRNHVPLRLGRTPTSHHFPAGGWNFLSFYKRGSASSSILGRFNPECLYSKSKRDGKLDDTRGDDDWAELCLQDFLP